MKKSRWSSWNPVAAFKNRLQESRKKIRDPKLRGLRLEPLEERQMLSITVNSLLGDIDSDPNTTTLYEAVNAANNTAGLDTIDFDASLFSGGSATITLTNGQLTITDDLDIDGPGATSLTIDADDQSRVFFVSTSGVTASFSGMTITGGNASDAGGAIRVFSSDITVDDVHFLGNTAQYYGGGIYLDASTASISNSSFTGNSASAGGGISSRNMSEVTVSQSTFTSNIATNEGGGISASNLLTVVDSDFIGNTAGGLYGGGGISISTGTLAISGGSTFINNEAIQGTAGGGFRGYASTISVNDSVLQGNSATYGGGIHLWNCDLEVSDTSFDENTASYGGGIRAAASSTVAIENSTFSDNSATVYGGGIRIEGSTGSISNSSFTGNDATNYGGGIYAYDSDLDVAGTTLSGNTANYGGGIHAREGSDLQVTNSTISGNIASTWGGGIYTKGNSSTSLITTVDIVNTTITANEAGQGGGVYINENTIADIDDSTFLSNTADYGGGLFSSYSTAYVNDSTFQSNSATSEGGGISLNYSTLEATGTTLFDGNTAYSGGGIRGVGVNQISLTGSTFSNNSAIYGGGGFYGSGTVDIYGALFTDNSSGGYGGGIYKTNGTLIVSGNSIFMDNQSDYGGAIRTYGSTVDIDDSTFQNNFATSSGGAIHVHSSTLDVSDSLFDENTAHSGGGIGGSVGSDLTVTDSTFSYNVATYLGGGICSDSGTLAVSGGSYTNNSANYGGGIYIYLGALTISDGTVITNNTATGHGGGIRVNGVTTTISDAVISNNTASYGGGMAFLSLTTAAMITNSTLTDNVADNYGGGIYADAATLDVSDNSRFWGNHASRGGAIAVVNSSEIDITESSLFHNWVTEYGGAVYLEASIGTMTNLSLYYNSATQKGGGIYINATSNADVINSTLTGNRVSLSSGSGGGVYVETNGIATVANSIVALNLADTNPDIDGTLTASSVSNLIGIDPIFFENPWVGPDGVWGTADDGGNLHLAPISPAINAGDNATANFYGLTTDLDGKTRIVDQTVDIGAYEYNPIVVSTLTDELDTDYTPGDLSLREAIYLAEQDSAFTTIVFDSALFAMGEDSITLNGYLSVESDVAIIGPSANLLTIDAGGQSGVFFIEGGTKSFLSGMTITGGADSFGAGIYVDMQAALTVRDSIITGNVAEYIGGGIYCDAETNVSVVNSVISGNIAEEDRGGGIYSDADLRILQSTIAGNEADTGGGIYGLGTTYACSSIIALNTASSSAPDVYGELGLNSDYNLIGIWTDASIPAENTLFGTTTAPLDPGFLDDPFAGANEGDLLLLPTSPAIDKGRDLVAEVYNLAMDLAGNDRIVNDAVDIGAYEYDPILVSTLTDESDTDYSYGDLSLREAIELAENKPGFDFIAFDPELFTDGTSPVPGTIVLSCDPLELCGDDVYIYGPGADLLTIDADEMFQVFYVAGQNVVLSGMTITGGTAEDGGGIYVDMDAELEIRNSIITDNTAVYYGGGILCRDATMTVINTLIEGNDASEFGGGISSIGASNLHVINSTIVNNAAYFGGGLHIDSYGSATMFNSIVAQNTSDDIDGSLSANSDYNIVGIWPGLSTPGPNTLYGNSSTPFDPGFVDSSAGDWHLLEASSGVDAGNNTPVIDHKILHDLDGYPRIISTSTDIGVYEYKFTPNLQIDHDFAVVLDSTLELEALLTDSGFLGQLPEGTFYYSIDWGDGTNRVGWRVYSAFDCGYENVDGDPTVAKADGFEFSEIHRCYTLGSHTATIAIWSDQLPREHAYTTTFDVEVIPRASVEISGQTKNVPLSAAKFLSLGTSGEVEYVQGSNTTNEGEEYVLTITCDATVTDITVNWGDGQTSNLGDPEIKEIVSNEQWQATHVYKDDGYYSISVTFNEGTANEIFVPFCAIPGDANLDGKVDASDATIFAGNWQNGPNATWKDGDFNGDGYVNASDATIFAGNWQAGVGVPATNYQLAVNNVAPKVGIIVDQYISADPSGYLPGDANYDGQVNASDATILAGNWQAGPGATWQMGDFNGDGYVNSSDVTILAGNWQQGGGFVPFDFLFLDEYIEFQTMGSLFFKFKLTKIDPGEDLLTSFTVNWGDSSQTTYTKNGTAWTVTGSEDALFGAAILPEFTEELTVSHTYLDSGNYRITIEMTDEDGTYNPYGNPGIIDAVFNDDGMASADFGEALIAKANAILIQPDGKIVIGGCQYNESNPDEKAFALVRFDTAGKPDSSFGGLDSNGIAALDLHGIDEIHALALQWVGNEWMILAAGTSENANGNLDFTILRYNQRGSLDERFGENGIVRVDFNGGDDIINALIVDEDGNILVDGSAENAGENCLAIARFTADGTPDTSFHGGSSKILLPHSIGSEADSFNALSILADGSIVAAGKYDGQMALVRFYKNGSAWQVDSDFDNDTSDGDDALTLGDGYLTGVAVDTENRIVTSGYTFDGAENGNFTIVRLQYEEDPGYSAWLPDDDFGVDGYVSTDFGNDRYEWATSMVLDADNNVLVAGYEQAILGDEITGGDAILAKYLAETVYDEETLIASAGDLDPHFGDSGKLFIGTFDRIEQATAVAIDCFGEIYLAGNYTDGTGTPNNDGQGNLNKSEVWVAKVYGNNPGLNLAMLPFEIVIDENNTGQDEETTDFTFTWTTAMPLSDNFNQIFIDWGDGQVSIGTAPTSGNDWGNGIAVDGNGNWTVVHTYPETGPSDKYEITMSIADESGSFRRVLPDSHIAVIDRDTPFTPVIDGQISLGFDHKLTVVAQEGVTYNIQTWSSASPTWQPLGTAHTESTNSTTGITTLSFHVPDTGRYYCRVQAEDSSHQLSNWTKPYFIGEEYSEKSSFGVNAKVDDYPDSFTLYWPKHPDFSSAMYRILRREKGVSDWTIMEDNLILDANPQGYVEWTDSTITAGVIYEYSVDIWFRSEERWNAYNDTVWVYSEYGKEVDGSSVSYNFENRGSILLIIDDRFTNQLEQELNQLKADLVGDGWNIITEEVYVVEHSDLGTGNLKNAADIKGLIQSYYNTASNHLQSVLLFGHIPVVEDFCDAPETPYSDSPDGHGARLLETDDYYADMDTWVVSASGQYNYKSVENLPGNAQLELQVGRIDMYNLDGTYVTNGIYHYQCFAEAEVDLLRRYLDKDHAYRSGEWEVKQRATATRAGAFSPAVAINGDDGECFSAGTLANLVGLENCIFDRDVSGDSHKYFDTNGEIYAFGCGSGTGSSKGIASGWDNFTTATLSGNEENIALFNFMNSQDDFDTMCTVFNAIMWSYCVEWNISGNVMRAMLANDGYALTVQWSSGIQLLSTLLYDPMVMGATVGESHQFSKHSSPKGNSEIFCTLLGDPTLRQHVVTPVSNVIATENGSDIDVSWTASPDAPATFDDDTGYLVYRYEDVADKFIRLTDAPITTTNYTEIGAAADSVEDVYMVRMVVLQETPGGNYYNGSQGVFCEVDSAASTDILYRVNVAGSTIIEDDANWQRDSEAMPSEYLQNDGTYAFWTDNENIDAIFRSARMSDMNWDFNVGANRTVEIDLYFAEIDENITGSNQREFDVEIEGATILNDYDIFEEAGGAYIAITETFTFTVGADGILNIDLSSVLLAPLICGIEIRLSS